MPAEKLTQTFADQGTQAMNVAQDSMRRYEQWLDSYQQLLKSSLVGTQMTKVGLHSWQRHMEYMTALLDASSSVARATSDYFEKMITQTMPEWTEAAKLASERGMETAREGARTIRAA